MSRVSDGEPISDDGTRGLRDRALQAEDVLESCDVLLYVLAQHQPVLPDAVKEASGRLRAALDIVRG